MTSPGPARPVFRSNADMMLLTTRLRIDPNGQPHIPGNIEIWRKLFINHPHGKYDGKLTRLATTWKEPDDVLEALFAPQPEGGGERAAENFHDAERCGSQSRAAALLPLRWTGWRATYKTFGAQYAIFNDGPSIADQTIMQFLDTAESIDHMKDVLLRQNTAATMQALVGLWQIFSRQGSLPASKQNETLAGIVKPFDGIQQRPRAVRCWPRRGENSACRNRRHSGRPGSAGPHRRSSGGLGKPR